MEDQILVVTIATNFFIALALLIKRLDKKPLVLSEECNKILSHIDDTTVNYENGLSNVYVSIWPWYSKTIGVATDKYSPYRDIEKILPKHEVEAIFKKAKQQWYANEKVKRIKDVEDGLAIVKGWQ